MASNNFSIEGRAFAAGFKDIQRNWLWELSIIPPPVVKLPGGGEPDSNRLLVHCRSAVIPGRTQEMITSNFGGMKQYFAGKPEFPGTFAVNIEDTEDMYIRTFLNNWQEAIFGTSDKTANQGYSSVLSVPTGQKKGLVATTMELQLFKYDGNMTDYKFRFINGIIQGVGDVTVAYDSAESVKYDATFQYDYFDILKNS
jgi:hypothetical protein